MFDRMLLKYFEFIVFKSIYKKNHTIISTTVNNKFVGRIDKRLLYGNIKIK